MSDCIKTVKVKDAVQKKDYQRYGQYPIISQEKDFISGYCDSIENLNSIGEVVIFGDHTRVLKFVDFDFCVGADGVKVIRPNSDINTKYLFHFLKWVDIPSNGYSRHFKFLKELNISYPSLSIQQAITSELDAIQTMIDGYKAQLEDLDALAQSIFLDMFGDPVSNPKGWEKGSLNKYASIGTGATPSRKIVSYYEGDIPWVKSTEVHNSYIWETQEHITKEAIDNSNCSIYLPDTILVAMYGQGKTRGKVGLLRIKAATNQACAAIQCKDSLNPTFCYWHFQMCYEANRELGNGTNQKNMNLTIVGNIKFIIPPLSLQQEFAFKIESIEKQKELICKQLEDAKTMMAERMQYYFS
ncbi:restriction endonuclease subunit S [Akkermansia muciniphila]|uniref:restriction endonuclease subunit S n=1 Tax=Akkermansia muciniphila TaxID=239935 RepID=UPI001C062405|nr:restriction endonuclease subunit S [Akkermansia muciniphila]MBS5975110.1 restriction endonuclease subunit S [Akkermansia muciniphila]QWP52277.1 restriction endonuclease subunit S [Akkermansia muciniphila]QWP57147.1 restriction endonuclease subunit S [Akkermansia muciniphila]QWP59465.1 restriction endonuclease subunit S [Akkermansia muciniphila]